MAFNKKTFSVGSDGDKTASSPSRFLAGKLNPRGPPSSPNNTPTSSNSNNNHVQITNNTTNNNSTPILPTLLTGNHPLSKETTSTDLLVQKNNFFSSAVGPNQDPRGVNSDSGSLGPRDSPQNDLFPDSPVLTRGPASSLQAGSATTTRTFVQDRAHSPLLIAQNSMNMNTDKGFNKQLSQPNQGLPQHQPMLSNHHPPNVAAPPNVYHHSSRDGVPYVPRTTSVGGHSLQQRLFPGPSYPAQGHPPPTLTAPIPLNVPHHQMPGSPRGGSDTQSISSRDSLPRMDNQIQRVEYAEISKELILAKHSLASVAQQMDVKDRRLSSSLLSIKLFWSPMLDKEKKARQEEKKRADDLQRQLDAQKQKSISYAEKIVDLQKAYEELKASAEKRSRIEEEMRKGLELRYRSVVKELSPARMKRKDGGDTDSTTSIESSALVGALKEQVATLKKDNERLQSELFSMMQKWTSNTMYQDLEALRKECAELKTSSSPNEALVKELDSLRKECAELKASSSPNEALVKELDSLRKECAELKASSSPNEALVKELDSLRKECAELKASSSPNEALVKELDSLRKECAELKASSSPNEALVKELDSLRKECAELKASSSPNETLVKEIEGQIVLNAELEESNASANTQLSPSLSSSSEQEAQLRALIDKREATIRALKAEIKTSKEKSDEQMQQLAALRKQHENEVQDFQSQIAAIKQSLGDISSTPSEIDSKMASPVQDASSSNSLSERYTELEGEYHAFKMATLIEIKSLKNQLDDVEAEKNMAEKKAQSMEKEGSVAQGKLLFLSKENEAQERALLEKDIQHAEKEKEMRASLEKTNKELRETKLQLSELRGLVDKEQGLALKKEGSIEQLRLQNEHLDHDLKTVEHTLAITQQQYMEEHAEFLRRVEELEGLLRDKEDEIIAMSSLEENVRNAEKAGSMLSSKITTLEFDLVSAKQAHRDEAASLRSEIDNLNTTLREKSALLSTLAADHAVSISNMETKNADLRLELDAKESLLAQALLDRTKVKELEKEIDQLKLTLDEKEQLLTSHAKENHEILGALRSQITTLKRETFAAEEHNTRKTKQLNAQISSLNDKLRDTEIQLAEKLNLITELTSSLEKLHIAERERVSLRGKVQALEETMSSLAPLTAEREALKKSFSEAEECLQKLKEENAQMKSCNEEQSAQLAILKERESALLASNTSHMDQLKQTSSERDALLALTSQHETQIKDLHAKLEGSTAALSMKENELKTLISVHETTVSSMDEEAGVMRVSIATKDAIISELQSRMATQEALHVEQTQKNESQSASKQALEDDIVALRRELASIQHTVAQKENLIQQTNSLHQEALVRSQEQDKLLSDRDVAILALKNEVLGLETTLSLLNAQEAAARETEASLRDQLRGIKDMHGNVTVELANKKDEMLRLSAQLSDMQNTLLAREGEFTREKNSLLEQCARLESVEAQLRETVAERDKQTSELHTQLASSNTELQGKATDLENATKRLQDEIVTLKADKKTLQSSLNELESKVAEMTQTIKEKEKLLSELNSSFSSNRETVEALSAKLKLLQQSEATLREQFATLHEAEADLKDQNKHLLARIDEAAANARRRDGEVQALQATLAEQRVAMATRDAELAELKNIHQGQSSELEEKAGAMRVAMATKEAHLLELTSQLTKMEAQINDLRHKESELASSLKHQQEDNASLRKEYDGLRASAEKTIAQRDELHAMLKVEQAALLEQQRVVSEREESVRSLSIERDTLERELQSMKDQDDRHIKTKAALKDEIAQLQALNERHTIELSRKDDSLTLMGASHEQTRAALVASEARSKELALSSQKTIASLEQEIAHVKATSALQEKELVNLKNKLEEVETAAKLKETEATSRATKAEEENNKLKRNLEEVSSLLKEKKASISSLQTDLKNENLKSADLEKALNEKDASIKAFKGSLEKLETACAALREREAMLVQTESSLKEQLSMASLRVAQMQDEGHAASTQQTATQASLAECRILLASRDAQITELNASLQKKSANLESQSKELTTVRTQCEDLRREKNSVKEKLDIAMLDLQQKQNELNSTTSTLKEEILSKMRENDALKTKCLELEAKHLKARNDFEALNERALSMTKSSEVKETLLTEAHADVARLNLKIESLHSSVSEKDAMLEDLQKQIIEQKETFGRREAEARLQYVSRETSWVDSRAKMEDQISVLEENNAVLKHELEEARAALEERTNSASLLEEEATQLKSRLATLASQHAEKVNRMEQHGEARDAIVSSLELRVKAAVDESRFKDGELLKLRAKIQSLEGSIDALEKDKAGLHQAANELRTASFDLVKKNEALSKSLEANQLENARLEDVVIQKEKLVLSLEASYADLEEKMHNEKTSSLLNLVEEKDARIALLEIINKDKYKNELKGLIAEKEELVKQLRDQSKKRVLKAAPSDVSLLDRTRDGDNRENLLVSLESKEDDGRRLRHYIDQLLTQVLNQPDNVTIAIMTGLPRVQQDQSLSEYGDVSSMSIPDLRKLIRRKEDDNKNLEKYVEQLIARIVEHRPAILEVMNYE